MYINIRCGCGDCIHFDECRDAEIVFHDDPVCENFESKFENRKENENESNI